MKIEGKHYHKAYELGREVYDGKLRPQGRHGGTCELRA